jgi:hypothetical protein
MLPWPHESTSEDLSMTDALECLCERRVTRQMQPLGIALTVLDPGIERLTPRQLRARDHSRTRELAATGIFSQLGPNLRRFIAGGPWMRRLLLSLIAACALVALAGVSKAQSAPMPTAPPTKLLAIGTFAPGTDMQLVQRTLPAESRETMQLYLEGKIDQWYSLQDRPGVVFILNMTDINQAHEMLDALPLGKAHLMTFSFLPLGPLKPLAKLLAQPSPQ